MGERAPGSRAERSVARCERRVETPLALLRWSRWVTVVSAAVLLLVAGLVGVFTLVVVDAGVLASVVVGAFLFFPCGVLIGRQHMTLEQASEFVRKRRESEQRRREVVASPERVGCASPDVRDPSRRRPLRLAPFRLGSPQAQPSRRP